MAETSFIVRMDAELLHKLDYIAKYDDRSRNAEVTRQFVCMWRSLSESSGKLPRMFLPAPHKQK